MKWQCEVVALVARRRTGRGPGGEGDGGLPDSGAPLGGYRPHQPLAAPRHLRALAAPLWLKLHINDSQQYQTLLMASVLPFGKLNSHIFSASSVVQQELYFEQRHFVQLCILISYINLAIVTRYLDCNYYLTCEKTHYINITWKSLTLISDINNVNLYYYSNWFCSDHRGFRKLLNNIFCICSVHFYNHY